MHVAKNVFPISEADLLTMSDTLKTCITDYQETLVKYLLKMLEEKEYN